MARGVSYRLVNQDCHEFLRTLPDSSVDLVCTDPPYHTTNLPFDRLEVRWPELWTELYRVCKPTAVQVMFAAQPFTTDLINSNRKRFKYPLVWVKSTVTGGLNCSYRPLTAHEDILVFSENLKAATYNPQRFAATDRRNVGTVRRRGDQKLSTQYGHNKPSVYHDDGTRYPTSVLSFGSGTGGAPKAHPTQKPESLVSYLVQTFAKEGDTVLDCFMGSGTTGAVCAALGRRFLGAEIDPVYFASAERRIRAAYARVPLNFTAPPEAPNA